MELPSKCATYRSHKCCKVKPTANTAVTWMLSAPKVERCRHYKDPETFFSKGTHQKWRHSSLLQILATSLVRFLEGVTTQDFKLWGWLCAKKTQKNPKASNKTTKNAAKEINPKNIAYRNRCNIIRHYQIKYQNYHRIRVWLSFISRTTWQKHYCESWDCFEYPITTQLKSNHP